MNRRKFLNWFSLVWISSYLPLALTACFKSQTDQDSTSQTKPEPSASLPPASSARADGFVPVGSLAKLKDDGVISLSREDTSVIIVNNPSTPNTPFAVNSICTHRGCLVEWQQKQEAFVCPCHDARYSQTGKVLDGPATNPLKTYEVKSEGDTVLVKIV